MVNILKVIILVILTINLTGCFMPTANVANSAAQSSQSRINLLNKQLMSYGVSVIRDGDSIKFVLSNKTLFNSGSANFTKNAYKTLDLVFSLTSYYEKSIISVSGFAKANSLDTLSKAMAAERAYKVVQYLWGLKIDAGFVYVIKDNVSPLSDCVVVDFHKLN